MAKKTESTVKKTIIEKEIVKEAKKETANAFSIMKELSQIYDRDYFENGIATKKSNYIDYSWTRLGSYFQKTAKHIIDKFSPSSVLDVGCAKGFLVKALSELGVDAYGIDPSEYAIAEAHPDIKNKIAKGIAQANPADSNHSNVVICFDVLEHISDDDIPKVLQELFRVSKQWVILRVVTKGLPDDVDASHASIHDKTWWEEKIKEAGGIVEPTENYANSSVWWFNVPEFLIVARKAI